MKVKNLASVMAAAVMMLASANAVAKNDLASFHLKMGDCQTCHADGKMKDIKKSITDSETHINAQCKECHGGFADLADKKLKLDPHGSHLGEINCTTCHSGHAKPKLTCNNCHNFKMEMPFADAKAKKKWDGDWDQDKIKKAIARGPVETVDVVVVGGGNAGFNAALSAQVEGAKVLLLEKAPYVGGNSMLAAGGINAVGTPQQKAKGIKDSVNWFIEDTMKGGRYKNDPKLVKILGEQSADAVKWLESLGVNLDDLTRSGGARVQRTHRPHGGASAGPQIMATLNKVAKERGIPVRLNSRVEKIVLNDDKSVAGVVVHGRHSGYNMIAAGSVVLATGGYGMNKQMIAYYRPTFKDMTSSNNVTATGDGILLAKEIGASMTDIDWVQAHPTVGKDSRILISETVRGVGAIMVNTDGQRFVNELTTRDRASDAILKQKGKYAWLVFDKQLVEKKKMIRGYDRLGMLSKGSTIEELAKATGMKDLAKTVADYNKYQAAGKDAAFGREDMPIKFNQPPFYAVKVAPGIHHTMGGVAIDTDANVLNLQSWKMDGLFAAGEVTGGVHGFNRLGGNAIADTVIFGRIAGKNAAKHALKKK
ncbi:flavocytochrome c [Shewanella intestini]|uniref:Fumarate reductase n=1 Tax=Shewanella intestini TaxID=2017544 RepID=A0ABS5I5G5_9GAMM|nr:MULTISPECIES: flavocytochrome c [Shewanella]MBR9729270.1 flavocytochrome c [Shewanella intestini]MRG35415.1 flavocytochrome c [Shewanella sp. XMDDZSB0408]